MCERKGQKSDRQEERCWLWLLWRLLFFYMPARLLATFSFCVPTVSLSPPPEYGCPAHLNNMASLPLSSSSLCLQLRLRFFLTFPITFSLFLAWWETSLFNARGTIKVHRVVKTPFLSGTYTCLHCNCDFSHKFHNKDFIQSLCHTSVLWHFTQSFTVSTLIFLSYQPFSSLTLYPLDISVGPTHSTTVQLFLVFWQFWSVCTLTALASSLKEFQRSDLWLILCQRRFFDAPLEMAVWH